MRQSTDFSASSPGDASLAGGNESQAPALSVAALNAALREAVIYNDAASVQRLLAQGANPDGDRDSAHLHTAIFSRNEEMTRFFLDAGASVSKPDESGQTPLFYAAVGALRPLSRNREEAESIFRLIAQRAPSEDFNRLCQKGRTVAMQLALSDRPELVRHVLPRSDLSVVDPKGRAVFQLALDAARESDVSGSPRALRWRAVDILAEWASDEAIEQSAKDGLDANLAPFLAARVEAIALRRSIEPAALSPGTRHDASGEQAAPPAGKALRI